MGADPSLHGPTALEHRVQHLRAGAACQDWSSGPKWLLRKTANVARIILLLLWLGEAGAPRATREASYEGRPGRVLPWGPLLPSPLLLGRAGGFRERPP